MNDYKVLIDVLKIRSEYSRDSSFWNEAVANDIDRAIDAIEQLVRERDAAVADLKQFLDCDVCKNNNDECLNNGLCKECSVGKSTRKHWEWRGVQE